MNPHKSQIIICRLIKNYIAVCKHQHSKTWTLPSVCIHRVLQLRIAVYLVSVQDVQNTLNVSMVLYTYALFCKYKQSLSYERLM